MRLCSSVNNLKDQENSRTSATTVSLLFLFKIMMVWIWIPVTVKHKENWEAGSSKIYHHTESPDEQHSLSRSVPAEIFKHEAGCSDSQLEKSQKTYYSWWFRNCFKLVTGHRTENLSFFFRQNQDRMMGKRDKTEPQEDMRESTLLSVGKGRGRLQVWEPARTPGHQRGEDEKNNKTQSERRY